MADGSYDVIIVGGGPGGSTCAAYLGKMGHSILLLEKQKFPRDKTCGDAVSGKSRSILRDLGITDIVENVPHFKVFGVMFSSPDGTTVDIPIPQDRGIDYGYCLPRYVYDNLLFQYAKKLVASMEEFEVTDVIKEGDKVVGVRGLDKKAGTQKEFRAKIVVGADGATSIVARKLGLADPKPEHICGGIRAYYKGVKGLTKSIELHFVDSLIPGYFWIFPEADGMANVGAGMLTSDMQKKHVNLKDEMMRILKENPKFKDRFEGAELVEGSIKGWNLPMGSIHRKAAGEGFVLLGDAASLIDPFSGEGVGNAMTSGKIAAATIHKALGANDFSEKMLSEYDKNLWNAIGHELHNSHKMQRYGRIRWLLNMMMHKAERSEWLRKELSTSLLDQHARQELSSPLFYLRVLLA
ncbi:MAG TPA: geranylgeranyl reductase family protein [Candidatus Norongarragalinales archaeon]|nr:geranylgeranyl reductase family protein [Candidatus Norongarragalinales archaeon]